MSDDDECGNVGTNRISKNPVDYLLREAWSLLTKFKIDQDRHHSENVCVFLWLRRSRALTVKKIRDICFLPTLEAETKIINKTRGSTREVLLRSHIFMSRTGQVLRRHSALIWPYEICRRNQMIRNFDCVNFQLICSQDGKIHVEDPSRQRRASSFSYT